MRSKYLRLSKKRASQLPTLSFINEIDLSHLAQYREGILNLKCDDHLCGRVIIKHDSVYLELEDNTPSSIILSGSVEQSNLFVRAANSVVLKLDDVNHLSKLSIDVHQITIQSPVYLDNILYLNSTQSLALEADVKASEMTIQAHTVTSSANHVIRCGQLNLCAERVVHQGHLFAKTGLSIKSNHCITTPGCKVDCGDNTVLVGEAFQLEGDLAFGKKLFCKAKHVLVSTSITSLKEVCIRAQAVRLVDQGRVILSDLASSSNNILRQIDVEILQIEADVCSEFSYVHFNLGEFIISSDVKLNHCKFECDSVYLQGQYQIQDSVGMVVDKMCFQGDKLSYFANSRLETAQFLLAGQVYGSKTEVLTDQMEFASLSVTEFHQCDFEVNGFMITADERVYTKFADATQIIADQVNLLGKFLLSNCQLQTDELFTFDGSIIDNSSIVASQQWVDKGASVYHSQIQASLANLRERVMLQDMQLETSVLNFAGSGSIDDSVLRVHEYLFTTIESQIAFEHSSVYSQQNYWQGQLNFTNSRCRTQYIQQITGETAIYDSVVNCTNIIYTQQGSVFRANENAYIDTALAFLSGHTSFNNCLFNAQGRVTFNGQTSSNQSEIHVQEPLHFADQDYIFNASSIQCSSDLLTQAGQLIFKANTSVSCEELSQSGHMQISNYSQLNTQDIKILGKLGVDKAHVQIQTGFSALKKSDLAICESQVNTQQMMLSSTLNARMSKLNVSSSLICNFRSNSQFNTVDLEVGDTVKVGSLAKLQGDAVSLKPKHLSNQGIINFNKQLGIEVNKMNNYGSIQGGEDLQVKAQSHVHNFATIQAQTISLQATTLLNIFGAHIRGEHDTNIQASIVYNMLANIASANDLNIDSFINLNLLSFYQGAHTNIRTLINLNYGIYWPSGLSSLKDLVSIDRLIFMARYGFNILCPHYANTVCLALIGSNISWGLYQSVNKDRKSLLKAITESCSYKLTRYREAFDDAYQYSLLPLILMLTGDYLTAYQYVQMIKGSANELFSAEQETLNSTQSGENLNLINASNDSSCHSSNNTDEVGQSDAAEQPADAQEDVQEKVGCFATNVVNVVIQSIIPSVNNQSAITINMGLQTSGNLFNRSFYDINYGMKTGWNLVDNYSRKGINVGKNYAINLVNVGPCYDNYGELYSVKNTNLAIEDEFRNHQGADCHLIAPRLAVSNFVNEGGLELKSSNCRKSNLVFKHFKQTKTGKSLLFDVQCHVETDANLEGKYTFQSESSLIAQNIHLNGVGHIDHSLLGARDNLNQSHTLNAYNSELVAGKGIYYGGQNNMYEILSYADQNTNFRQEAKLDTHNVIYKSGNQISHQSKQHKQTGELTFEAYKVNTQKNSYIYTPKSEKQSSYLKIRSQQGRFKGKKDLGHGAFQVNQLNKAEYLIGQRGQSSHQHFSQSLHVNTDQHINFKHIKPRQCDLSVRASSAEVSDSYKSQHKLELSTKQGAININADFGGQVTIVDAKKDKVNIRGAAVGDSGFTGIYANKNVNVEATEQTYQGPHDKQKVYKQGFVKGGKGSKKTKGKAVFISSNKKANLDASNVTAEDDIMIRGKKGVHINARSHTYVAEKGEKVKKDRLFKCKYKKEKFMKTNTQTATSNVVSQKGKSTILSDKESVEGVPGSFLAKKGTDVIANKDIKLRGLKSENRRYSEKRKFKIFCKKRTESHQSVKPITFVSGGGNTSFYARQGNIGVYDPLFIGKGDISFRAPNGYARVRSSKLEHRIEEKKRFLKMSHPFTSTFKKLKNKDLKGLSQQLEPALAKGEATLNADTNLEAICDFANTFVQATDAAQALKHGQYGKRLAQDAGITTQVDVGLNKSKTKARFETSSGSGFYLESGRVTFDCQDDAELTGVPIEADEMEVNANHLKMQGHGYESSYESTTQTTNLSTDVTTGKIIPSGSYAKIKGRTVQNQRMDVNLNNGMQVNVKNMTLDNAHINCDKITGNVDQLNMQSNQDQLEGYSYSVSASGTGMGSASYSHMKARQVNQPTGINARSDINKADFRVGQADCTASKVTSNKTNHFNPDRLKSQTLHDYKKSRSVGFAGNVVKTTQNLKDAHSGQLDTSNKSGITTVSYGQTDYQAEYKSTIYGRQGVNSSYETQSNLNTTDKSGVKVNKNTKQSLKLDVPTDQLASIINQANSKPPQSTFENASQQKTSTSQQLQQELDSEQVQDSSETETTTTQPNSKKPSVLNPRLKRQTLGLKQNRGNNQQFYNKKNGQYTNIKKEANQSRQKNQVMSNTEVVFCEKGKQGDGIHYKAKIDTQSNHFVMEGGYGKQLRLNLTSGSLDLGYVGTGNYAVDGGSLNGLCRAFLQTDGYKSSAELRTEVGATGPSISGQFAPKSINLFGLTINYQAEGSAGIGWKFDAGFGAEVDASRLKGSCYYKFGLFTGLGFYNKNRVDIGVDWQIVDEIYRGDTEGNWQFVNEMHNAYHETINNDEVANGILNKLYQGRPLQEWEHNHLNDLMEEIPVKAQIRHWSNNQ